MFNDINTHVMDTGLNRRIIYVPMDKKKLYIIFTIIIVALLPSAVFASVVISQSYSVSTTTATNPIIMTDGPNYKNASSLGFITLKNGTTPTDNTIKLGYVDNDTCVELVNVLEVKNNSKVNAPTYVDLSVSSTADITVYYSSAPATAVFPPASPFTSLGTEVTTSSTDIPLPAATSTSTSALYISIVITGAVSSDITLTMSYSIQ